MEPKDWIALVGVICAIIGAIYAILSGRDSRKRADEATDVMAKTMEALNKDYTRIREDCEGLQRRCDDLQKLVAKTEEDGKETVRLLMLDWQTKLRDIQELQNVQAEQSKKQIKELDEQRLAAEARAVSAEKRATGYLAELEHQIARGKAFVADIEELQRKYDNLSHSRAGLVEQFDAQTKKHQADLSVLEEATNKQVGQLQEQLDSLTRLYQTLKSEQEQAQMVILQLTGQLENARKFLRAEGLSDAEIEDVLAGKADWEQLKSKVIPEATPVLEGAIIPAIEPDGKKEEESPDVKPNFMAGSPTSI